MDQAKLNRLREEDQGQLELLLSAVNGAMNALRRDECGDFVITGSRGTIRACGGKFYIYIQSRSGKAWTFAKDQLGSFSSVHQDGDAEGVLVFSKMPDADEAETLRKYIGLRQTREVSADQILKAREAVTKGGIAPPMRPSEVGAPDMPGPMRGAVSSDGGAT
jgi:hypothetical protein